MKKLILFVILLAVVPFVVGKEGRMTLLAVQEGSDGYSGAIADLYLEIIPGSGRVFLETFPLLKIDTQISTRFAKEIACDYLNADCERYDFIYTINSGSVIVGGPSAGSSIATMTILMLQNKAINEEIAMTGTINSGGIVGPVGGLKDKIRAASENGIKTVLIPKGERFFSEGEVNISINSTINETSDEIDLYELGNELGIRVIEVGNLDDIMYIFTGKIKEEEEVNFDVNSGYAETMEKLAADLCKRSDKLKNNVLDESGEFNNTFEDGVNLTERGRVAFESEDFYSSASYCFGANVKFSYMFVAGQELSNDEFIEKIEVIQNQIDEFNEVLDRKEVRTITDLEAFVIVKERLTEASNELNDAISEIEGNNTEGSFQKVAYASERVNSAHSWFNFFDNRGKRINLNKENLRETCQNKLQEAEERFLYVETFIPGGIIETKKEIDLAYEDLNNGDYELCLFKASKAKAELDVFLSVLYVGEDKIEEITSQKLDVARKSILKQIKKGAFPILGYSYYEYANSLKGGDDYSTLLYLEYARELSNLDLYFKNGKKIGFVVDRESLFYIFGVISGIVVTIASIIIFKKIKNPSRTQSVLLGKKR
jgi:uncharacterized protein